MDMEEATGMGGERRESTLKANTLTALPVMALAVWVACRHASRPEVLVASAFFLCACASDLRRATIPNLLNLALLVAGFAWSVATDGAQGGLNALLGTLAGFAIFLPPYLLGMGAGDVKAMAALGALTGPAAIVQVFLYTAIAGGLLALLHCALDATLRRRLREAVAAGTSFLFTRDPGCLKPNPDSGPLRFPYSAAIAAGFYAFVNWGPLTGPVIW